MMLAREGKTQCVEKDSEALSGFSQKDGLNGFPVSATHKAWGTEAQQGRLLCREITSVYPGTAVGRGSWTLSEPSQIPGLRFQLEALTHSLHITSDFNFPTMPTMPSVLSHSLDHFCLE